MGTDDGIPAWKVALIPNLPEGISVGWNWGLKDIQGGAVVLCCSKSELDKEGNSNIMYHGLWNVWNTNLADLCLGFKSYTRNNDLEYGWVWMKPWGKRWKCHTTPGKVFIKAARYEENSQFAILVIIVAMMI